MNRREAQARNRDMKNGEDLLDRPDSLRLPFLCIYPSNNNRIHLKITCCRNLVYRTTCGSRTSGPLALYTHRTL